jgi:DNA-directed RNA polymerase sigma subunit (sigma70/sigma32)
MGVAVQNRAQPQANKPAAKGSKAQLKLLGRESAADPSINLNKVKNSKAANEADFRAKSTSTKSDRLSPEAVEARNNLIESHVEVAQKLAMNLMKRWNSRLPKEEVKSLANVALCEAAARFDETRGVKFVTYLFYFVKGQLGVAITSSVTAQKGTAFTYVPGEAIATPEEELTLKRAANNIAQVRNGFGAFDAAVADELVLNDQAGVGELAEKMGRARETASRARTDVRDQLIQAWKAA